MIRSGVALIVVFLIVVAFAAIAAADPANDIIVIGADARQDMDYSFSSNLSQLTEAVAPRIFLRWANAQRFESLFEPSASFVALIREVTPRIFLRWANTQRHVDAIEPSSSFLSRVREVTPRIFLRWANASREELLFYPVNIIDDSAAPSLLEIVAVPSGSSADIEWTTNEFADSEVRYGTVSGSYPNSVSDPLFVLEHSLRLTGLTNGVTYYYIVLSTDRSGNTAQSLERQFTFQSEIFTYLPLLAKR